MELRKNWFFFNLMGYDGVKGFNLGFALSGKY